MNRQAQAHSRQNRRLRQRSKRLSHDATLKKRIAAIRNQLPAAVTQKEGAFYQSLPKALQSDAFHSPGFTLESDQGIQSQYWQSSRGSKYLVSGLGQVDKISERSDLIAAHVEKLMGPDRPFPSEIFVDTGKTKMEEGAIEELLTETIDKLNNLRGTSHQLLSIERMPETNLFRITVTIEGIREFSQLRPGEPRQLLDLSDRNKVRKSLEDALFFNDQPYSQLLMAELRVKNPAFFVEMHRYLKTLRTLGPSDGDGSKKYLGQGSYNLNLHRIERNIHRFWAGGPMNPKTIENILAMQAKVNESQGGPTPWKQILWTSGIANERRGLIFKTNNPLDKQLESLKSAGIEIRDIDQAWTGLRDIHQDAQTKAIAWTRQAKKDLDNKKYDRIKWFSDLVRLVAVYTEGGVYMDTDIGPGRIDLSDNQLFHLDDDGEIAMFGPPFRVPEDYTKVREDQSLGDSPEERIVRHANESIPALNYFLASRAGTKHLAEEIRTYLERQDLTSGMGRFGYLFVPAGEDVSQTPTPYAPPQQTMIPWLLDLDWTTEVSRGEG